MAGLMDILLALVQALCGGSATQEQPPSEEQKAYAERPPHEAITTRVEPRVAPEYRPQVSFVPYVAPLALASCFTNAS